METCLGTSGITVISLPNKNKGSKDYQKKIQLQKLNQKLSKNKKIKTQYDTDSNPYQNYVEITTQFSFRIYSNGTVTTSFPQQLIQFLDSFYTEEVRDCLE